VIDTFSSTRKLPSYISFEGILPSNAFRVLKSYGTDFAPRVHAILQYLAQIVRHKHNSYKLVEAMITYGIGTRMAETFPEALLSILKGPIVHCQAEPPTTWPSSLLSYVSREDLDLRIASTRLGWTDVYTSKVRIWKIHSIIISNIYIGNDK
jgi:hypothetical protein